MPTVPPAPTRAKLRLLAPPSPAAQLEPAAPAPPPDDRPGRARQVLRLRQLQEDCLTGANIADLLLHGLVDGVGSSEPGLDVLRMLRIDMESIAQLTMCASEVSASDMISISRHIGMPLGGFVRRLDVAISMLERVASGRRARRERRKARKPA